jgi:hypothetical protein
MMQTFDQALDECKKTFSLLGNLEVVQAAELGNAECGYKGAMLKAADKLSEQSEKRYIHPTFTATLYAHAEEKDQAIRWLERACEQRDPNLFSLGLDPEWESLHSRRLFRELVKRIGRRIIR